MDYSNLVYSLKKCRENINREMREENKSKANKYICEKGF